MRKFLAVTALLLLASCGFHLRGVANLPFKALYVDGGGSPALAAEISRAISTGTETRLVDKPADADAVLQIQSATRDKRILSLSGAGRVREFQLTYRVNYRLFDKQNRDLIASQPIELSRDMTYDDTQVLAKQQEEALLYQDMYNDALAQLIRRLAAAKLQPADTRQKRYGAPQR